METKTLSSSQRRCQALLMLYLPATSLTCTALSQLNGVDENITRQDLAEIAREIQRYHQLTLTTGLDGSYRISGSQLNQRLCLLFGLRRALRLCPDFVKQHFAVGLKHALHQQGIDETLYNDVDLQTLIDLCSSRLRRQFDSRDVQFLQLFLPWCLLQHQPGEWPEFTPVQICWLQRHTEFLAVREIAQHWLRRLNPASHPSEHPFLALLLLLLRTPDPQCDNHPQAQRLRQTITSMITHFHRLSGMQFSDEQGLADQLYVHLTQALDRFWFHIGIDNSPLEDLHRLYPRLLRTTRAALCTLEAEYSVQFSAEESGLVAIIFGAWLMQDSDLHEKQVLLLTGCDPRREQQIEQQLRELTLLPLNIKYLALHSFQQQGAPKDVALIVTPYATSLPLFSPPLIHAERSLNPNQQEHIRAMLEPCSQT